METVTYSLRTGLADSKQYYLDAAKFTTEVVAKAEATVGALLGDFILFLDYNQTEKLRARNEYMLDFLALGVFWQDYAGYAAAMKTLPGNLLIYLARLRRKGGLTAKLIDWPRGVLMALLLQSKKEKPLKPDMTGLDKLLLWLGAAGEFDGEVKRFKLWRDYLSGQPEQKVSEVLSAASNLAGWFETRSNEVLGCYTENVPRFLSEQRNRFREDYIACSRGRTGYHLNMVGAEIMNSAYRDEFSAAEQKVVLVPTCMRPADGCRAYPVGPGYHCARCREGCRVKELVMLGFKLDFTVFIVPHRSTISQLKKISLVNSKTGVVGVACVNSLIEGGLMLKSSNIPAQCVLLDYCGCKNHWHKDGIITEINTAQMEAIFNNKI